MLLKLPGYKNQYRAFSVLLGTFDSPDSVDADGLYGNYAMFAAPASLSCCFAETAVVSLDLVLLVTGTSCYCFIGTFYCCFLGTLCYPVLRRDSDCWLEHAAVVQ